MTEDDRLGALVTLRINVRNINQNPNRFTSELLA